MTTEIIITNLAVRAFHGVFPEERRLGNNFTVNAVLRSDFRPALTSDRLDDTLDYGAACDVIVSEMATPSALLEHVAGRIINALHTRFPQLAGGEITITKHNPPHPPPSGRHIGESLLDPLRPPAVIPFSTFRLF